MNAGWIVLIVFGSLFLLIALLLLSRVKLRVVLNENGSSFRVSWFFIRKKMNIDDATDLFASKIGTESDETTEEEETEDEKEDEEEKEKKKVPLSRQIGAVARLVSRLFDRLHGALTLRTRRVIVVVGTGDAAKTALLYGAVSAALAGLIEIVDRSVARVKTKGRDLIDVRADFVGQKTRAELDLVLSSRVYGMLRVLFAILTFNDHRKRRKPATKSKPKLPAPANTEPKND